MKFGQSPRNPRQYEVSSSSAASDSALFDVTTVSTNCNPFDRMVSHATGGFALADDLTSLDTKDLRAERALRNPDIPMVITKDPSYPTYDQEVCLEDDFEVVSVPNRAVENFRKVMLAWSLICLFLVVSLMIFVPALLLTGILDQDFLKAKTDAAAAASTTPGNFDVDLPSSFARLTASPVAPVVPTSFAQTATPSLSPIAPSASLSPIAPSTLAPTTAKPTMAKPTTPRPTPRPTSISESHLFEYLQNYTKPNLLLDEATPQGRAIRWLDHASPVAPYRLLQLYALLVLDFALQEDPVMIPRKAYNNTFSRRSGDDFCQWRGITCNEDDLVTELRWVGGQAKSASLDGLSECWAALSNTLVVLDLAQNHLHGSLDSLFSPNRNWTSLERVYLFENELEGTLPDAIADVATLKTLYLGHNDLTGTIPSAWGGYGKTLETLILHYNHLTGSLPMDWRMRSLYYLDLSNNQLSGTLPTDWDIQLVRLRHLHLDHNQFRGTIPNTYPILGNSRLMQLFLNDNFFEGAFPLGWLHHDKLTNVNIMNNALTQVLDDEICDMSVFEWGEMVELRADCNICHCPTLCQTCRET